MPDTPRTDGVRNNARVFTEAERQTGAMFLIAEMLERIAIALEKEAKE